MKSENDPDSKDIDGIPHLSLFQAFMPNLQDAMDEPEISANCADGFTFKYVRDEVGRRVEILNKGRVYHCADHCFRVCDDTVDVAPQFGFSYCVAEQIALVFHDVAHTGVVGRDDLTYNISRALSVYDSFVAPLYWDGEISLDDWQRGAELITATTSFNAQVVPETKKAMLVEAMDLNFMETDLRVFMEEGVRVLCERIERDRPASVEGWLEGVGDFVAEDGYLEQRLEAWRVGGLFDDGNEYLYEQWKTKIVKVRRLVGLLLEYEKGDEDFFSYPSNERASVCGDLVWYQEQDYLGHRAMVEKNINPYKKIILLVRKFSGGAFGVVSR